MKKTMYSLFAAALALTPAVAGAQFDASKSGQGSGIQNYHLTQVLANLMKGLLALVGVIAIIGFVVAGIMYITAAGDDENMKKAKKMMVYSITGIVVALIGWIILTAISTWLTTTSTTF